jgi:hypothetical protein
MQEQIADFHLELLKIAFYDGIAELIYFLNGEMSQAFERLFFVPWTFCPQFIHDVEQTLESVLLSLH